MDFSHYGTCLKVTQNTFQTIYRFAGQLCCKLQGFRELDSASEAFFRHIYICSGCTPFLNHQFHSTVMFSCFFSNCTANCKIMCSMCGYCLAILWLKENTLAEWMHCFLVAPFFHSCFEANYKIITVKLFFFPSEARQS